MSTYPDLYLPHALQQAQNALPPVPAAPQEPQKPDSPPQQFQTGWLTTFGIGTIFFSLTSQSLVVFLIGLILTIAFGFYSYLSYPKRLTQYENELRQYEQNYGEFLTKKQDYDREVQVIRSEKNVGDYRLLASIQVLKTLRPYPPDGENSDAPRGQCEGYFERYLTRYFPNKVKSGLTLEIPGFDYPYTPDFAYMNGSLYIDIEIDEPYVYRSKQPYHCLYDSKESNRNGFFLSRNWLVLRFAEEQVCRYPESCCKVVAQVISNIIGEPIPSTLRNVQDLPEVKRWTQSEAQQMADTNYRDTYLSECEL